MDQYPQPVLWAGIECTINRLSSGYVDQLALSGHDHRETDVDAICDLGISAIRYPILWERCQPDLHTLDFSGVARRLDRIRERGVMPIAGLMHHGSGPAFTQLDDPKFPKLFAAYALEVARHFPWIDHYTPINEPLTTARFSGLYGLWYPHEKNDVVFVRMLLHQLKGIVLGMEAIRSVNPHAKLVQTEDLGKTYSTQLLRYQADWENERRWLTWDILCGRLDETHPFFQHFVRLGIERETIQFFIDHPCPPDLIGVNHYVTSERFLDERVHRYPPHTHGGNTIHRYADVEAVRIRHKQPSGFRVLVRELWDRYQIPIAVTEAHLHCSRDEQMRWFLHLYNQSFELIKEGVSIKAVTAWSVLGAYGWNKLLTVDPGDYEPGAFDVSSGTRRPTAMAQLVRSLAHGQKPAFPGIFEKGWWEKSSRFFNARVRLWDQPVRSDTRPVWIIGKTGTLGQAFVKVCRSRSLHCVTTGRDEVCLFNEAQVLQMLDTVKPWAVVNAAGYVRVDDAERESEICFATNVDSAANLAQHCADRGIAYAAFSSDLVFDGNKTTPYVESDIANPLNVYGTSKMVAEQCVLSVNPNALMVRTSAFFGPWDRYNFVYHVVRCLLSGEPFAASAEIVSPTYLPHLAHAVLDLMLDRDMGIWHLANDGALSWFDFALEAARLFQLDPALIHLRDEPLPAPRPAYSALTTERSRLMPSLAVGLAHYRHMAQHQKATIFV